MSDISKLYSAENLRRAYRWVISNPDPKYKGFFRDSYSAYAISSGDNLLRLRSDLVEGRYEASHASKIFFPKSSGALRPITLLTTQDQIVFQACANVVADALYPSTKWRYRKSVFNHLYAGPRSRFFYLKWQDNYRMFGNALRPLHAGGYTHVANFDLASFYDSIDHNVLRHFLGELKLDQDFIEFVTGCLRTWTSSTWNNRSNAIYHNHGIPQGPLSSGIFSEVVLTYLDAIGERGRRTHYLRYVDDIKIMARDESHLRQKLIALDLCSKEIGLFPQTAKINIRKVLNPEDELKSVSRPPELSLFRWDNQKSLRRRLLEITRGGRVKSELTTRFKYLLAHATPHNSLNERLLSVFANQPEFSSQISYYFQRYTTLPHKAAQRIIQLVRRSELYHAIHADLLNACLQNMQEPELSQLSSHCYQRLFRKKGARNVQGNLTPQPTYKEALNAWVIRHRRISFAELTHLRDNEVDWWIRKSLFRELTKDQFGEASYGTYVNECLRHSESEIARTAVEALLEESLPLRKPVHDVNLAAKIPLRAAGLIRSIGRPQSMVDTVFGYTLRHRSVNYNWRKLLGAKHKQAQKIAVFVKQKFEVDIDACIVRLDSLCDLIFEVVVRRLVQVQRYGYGAILYSPHAPVKAAIPDTLAGFGQLHRLRLKSFTAHPRDLRTGSPTKRLKHSDFYKLRPVLLNAIKELETRIAP